MLYIDGSTIKLTRGDTAYLTIPLTTEVGAYEIHPEDTLTFSVKKNTRDDEYAFQKVITGDNTFHILPEDTAGLVFGKYTYDVQLDDYNGDVFTVITPSTFEVLKEVTHR